MHSVKASPAGLEGQLPLALHIPEKSPESPNQIQDGLRKLSAGVLDREKQG